MIPPQVAAVLAPILEVPPEVVPVLPPVAQVVPKVRAVSAVCVLVPHELAVVGPEVPPVLLKRLPICRDYLRVPGLLSLAELGCVPGFVMGVPSNLPSIFTDLAGVPLELAAILADVSGVAGDVAAVLPDVAGVLPHIAGQRFVAGGDVDALRLRSILLGDLSLRPDVMSDALSVDIFRDLSRRRSDSDRARQRAEDHTSPPWIHSRLP